MVRNLNDSPLERMVDAQQHARRENPFESSSVRDGRVRFIGGTLRVDAGGRAEIVGTLQVDGTSTVTGSFTVSGPWNLTGNGTITGNVTITGKVTQVGDMDIDGVLTVSGDGWSITGSGTISGAVNMTGSLDVDEGGYIQVGPTRISGSIEGLITSLIEIVIRTPLLRIIGALRVTQAAVFDGVVTMSGLIPISPDDAPGHAPGAVIRDSSNRLRVVTS